MNRKSRCAHCRRRFVPNPRAKTPCFCSKKSCQQARKAKWQRQKMATDPDDQAHLYVFLVLVADRNGLSYYGYDKICTLLRFTLDDYLVARNRLIEKDLIAFDSPSVSGPLTAHPTRGASDPFLEHARRLTT